MELRFLGGAGEVGRSAILVNETICLDFGMAAETPPRYPVGDISPEAVIVSHGHLDHVGALPTLMSGSDRPEIHWTPPTRELAHVLARDTLKLHGHTPSCPFTSTDVGRMRPQSHVHGYDEPFTVADHEITLFNAGHIPGSAHVLVDDGETRLFYTGDFHTDEQRLVSPSTARPDADVLLCETTYADVEHRPRKEVEREFIEFVRTRTYDGGTVVVPVFAIGRTQELELVCAANDINCYVDGMGVHVANLLSDYPSFLRDPAAFNRATSNARVVTGTDGTRRQIADGNETILTTAGMLTGGPAMTYLPAVHDDPTNAIAFTGYQVDGTPGRQLIDTGRIALNERVLPVSARVDRFDFSAHVDRPGLKRFLDDYRDATVLLNHGDDPAAFASALSTDGFNASAPELNETIVV